VTRSSTQPIALAHEGPSVIRASQIDAMVDWAGTWLYRSFGSDSQLLYIGVSSNLRERLRRHRQRAAWWPAAELIRLEPFAMEYLALDAERAAIRAERPQFNVRSAVR